MSSPGGCFWLVYYCWILLQTLCYLLYDITKIARIVVDRVGEGCCRGVMVRSLRVMPRTRDVSMLGEILADCEN